MKKLSELIHNLIYGIPATGTSIQDLPKGFKSTYPDQPLPFNQWSAMIQEKQQELAKH